MADEPDQDPLAESDIEGTTADDDSKRLQEVHLRALQHFDAVAVPQIELRAQSLEARRFVTIPGAQWEGTWGEQYENSPRPEVDKITKALEKIETDYRENRLTVDFVPGNGADPETADTLDGMHRADSYFFKAQQARDNAFQEGIRGGFGAWRLTTDYADPYDPDDDSQRVNPGLTIVDADQSVYFGPSLLYDKSDAKRAWILSAVPRLEAEERWGSENCIPWPDNLWKFTWDWYTPEVVRIAEYYEVEDKDDKLLIFTQDKSGEEQRYFASDIGAEQRADLKALGWTVRTRSIKRKRVHKYIMNGSCVLKDCGYIAGDMIPIVPFYFRRDFVDNMERWRGYVGKMMDRQRIYNSSISHVVETQSIAPYPVPIVADEQLTPDIAAEWARGNIDRHPFRRLLPLRDGNGQIVSAGPIGSIEPIQVQPATAALLQIASNDLTENDDTTDQVKSNVSADAMDIAAARVDSKSGIPLDNMRQSIAREGEIYLAMGREVYFEEGRKVETITMDGQDGEATLMQPYMDQANVFRIRNDLTQGRFKVVADVQESTATARAKTVKQNMEIANVAVAAQDMELAKAAILNAVMNQDGEGMQDMQAYARNQLISLGVVKPTPEEKQQIEQAAAQAQQQGPSPADKALEAQTGKLEAEALDKTASAHLKMAQAEAVGGPEKAPEVPTGLQAANDLADMHSKIAGAKLKDAQADHLRQGMAMAPVKHVADLLHLHASHGLAVRKQDHAEKQPKRPAA